MGEVVLIRRWLFGANLSVSRSELLFSLFGRAGLGVRGRLVSRSSDIVIEGYPRSGNSFAVHALTSAQDRAIRVASHYHKVGHVLRGLRLQVPTLILIRSPADAIVSTLVYHPWMAPKLAIRWYREFYEGIEPVQNRVVIADFDEVTEDFASVIDRVNGFFHTAFLPFEQSDERVDAVFRSLDDVTQDLGHGAERVSRPNDERTRRKAEVRKRLQAAAFHDEMERLRNLYARLTPR